MQPSPPRAREMVLVPTIYLALALWWLWPLPCHLSTHSAYATDGPAAPFEVSDWYLIVWALAWGAHALVTAPLHLFDANAFHPAPLSLAFSEHLLGHQPLFAPVYLLSGNPVLAVNALLLAMFTLSALGCYALARRFVGGPAAFVAGVLFSFCPWRHEGLYHLHLLGVQYLPLALLFTERWLERGQVRDACLLAVALVLQTLSSVYLAVALGVVYAPYVVLALWRWWEALDRRRLLGLGLAVAGAAAVTALASIPYVRLMRLGLISSYGTGEQGPAIDPVFAGLIVLHYLRSAGVGPFGYALVALALLPPWYGRRWPLAIGLMAIVGGIFVASGTEGLAIGGWHLPAPFLWLLDLVPSLANIRVPGRLVITAHLGFCLLAALGLARLLSPLRGVLAWGGAALVAGGVLASFQPLPALAVHEEPVCAEAPEPYAWLARFGEGRPLLELPAAERLPTTARRMYLGACHWLPMVGGYSAYPPGSSEVIAHLSLGLPDGRVLQDVVDTVDIGWIVVHLDELSPWAQQRWDRSLPPGLERVERFGDALLLRVTRAPGPGDRRARLFSTSETLGGAPLEPLGATCAGRLALAGPLPRLRAGRGARLLLAVTNQSGRAWPGLGVFPGHLLSLRACVGAAGAPCDTPAQLIGVDVPAGATETVRVALQVPPLSAGRSVVRVELWQSGDGPLERCGIAPLSIPVEVQARR